ncbi:hypothetical protein [Segetibacter aerophilus]|uniref:Uncharacterized protein n=1 Tax=Segetibacter aerophilus TaxID=670293 RepID=A0A512B9Z7_9BACT|nr:hypothetical protein [Segetibacter aerophilus]GEO08768.1 hypothetical protein SAE01_12640 [Segetibacter aerophilus]
MAILLKNDSLDKKVMDLIYTKQLQFKKEKGRVVSLQKTIERLLKEAYLKEGKEVEIHENLH